MIALRRRGDRVAFDVRVAPRASRTAVGGARAGALLVRVTAPPAEGAANAAVLEALSRALDVAPRELRIERGGAARTKTVSAPGRVAAAVRRLAAV